MKKLQKISALALLIGGLVFTTACHRNPNDPGTEFAPQMYLSKGYEPYSQTEKNKINPYGMNMRLPAQNTVARRSSNIVTGESNHQGDLMYYAIGKGDAGLLEAEKSLNPPFDADDKALEDGKTLYVRYCSPCHGEAGDGKGKVAGLYKGVPNYKADAYKNLNSGHIFHVITHGKGRMWSHASQLSPEERWKVVYYVHTLQGQDLKNKPVEFKAEKGATFILKNVLFKTGSADLEESSRKELDKLIDFLKKNKEVIGEISGHSDNEGDPKKNKEISEQRAASVDKYIEQGGIDKSRIKSVGMGDTQPKASNDTKEGKAQNRRIEFKIL
ncbi:MAG: hypothetical protein EAZ85_08260 [Bacteroidetes bacterium]|nr:MAG: hypothetical protein EAZ85_08260 [Bacteroidota bacterium]TAG89500.1 MAG: hypothetical protein EAZ20_06345 [Bacteroidota bacterium]